MVKSLFPSCMFSPSLSLLVCAHIYIPNANVQYHCKQSHVYVVCACVCAFVCVCIHIYTNTHTHTHTHTHARTRTYTHVRAYKNTHTQTHVHTHTHTQTQRKYTRKHTHLYLKGSGGAECVKCAGNTFKSTTGSHACTSCSPFYASLGGSVSESACVLQTECPAGFIGTPPEVCVCE